MNWKDHIRIGTTDALIMFAVVWTPLVVSMVIAYYFWGAENPREWIAIGQIIGITSSLAFLAMFIGFVYKPNNLLKKVVLKGNMKHELFIGYCSIGPVIFMLGIIVSALLQVTQYIGDALNWILPSAIPLYLCAMVMIVICVPAFPLNFKYNI